MITVLTTVLITILGHLRDLSVGYEYSCNWLISTTNLQVEALPSQVSEKQLVGSADAWCAQGGLPQA